MVQKLAERCAGQPTDADRDIDFAYRNGGVPGLTPLDAPSIPAWNWYLKSCESMDAFLEICAKREDAKSKMAGTISEKRMEDDKRQRFAVIDRLHASLTEDAESVLTELRKRWPAALKQAFVNLGWNCDFGKPTKAVADE